MSEDYKALGAQSLANIPPDMAYGMGRADGQMSERQRVSAYLRREAATISLRDGVADHLRLMALAIEKADHHK